MGTPTLGATDHCDLDNGGKREDCLDQAISREKDNLHDRINISTNIQDYQFVKHGVEYTCKDIHFTGVREFQVLELFYRKTGDSGFQPPLQYALRALFAFVPAQKFALFTPAPAPAQKFMYMTMKLKWTSLKLVMEVTQKSTSKTEEVKKGEKRRTKKGESSALMSSTQAEITFTTAEFPMSCHMKIISGPSLQLDRIEKAHLELSVDEGSLGNNIKLTTSCPVGPKEANAIKNAVYKTAQSRKIRVALELEVNRWLLSNALPTLAESVTGNI